MFILVYVLASICVILLRFFSYELGIRSLITNTEKRYRFVKWFGYLTITSFILLIPFFDDGTLTMLFVNIINIILAGLAGYGYILTFLKGVHDRESEND